MILKETDLFVSPRPGSLLQQLFALAMVAWPVLFSASALSFDELQNSKAMGNDGS